ncbi:MAG: hypothetical protein NVSMB68_15430 [Thermoanaerobaculia bacterium]
MFGERFSGFCRQQGWSSVLSIGFGAAFAIMFSIGKAHGMELLSTAALLEDDWTALVLQSDAGARAAA